MLHRTQSLIMQIWQCGGEKRGSLMPASSVVYDSHCLTCLISVLLLYNSDDTTPAMMLYWK